MTMALEGVQTTSVFMTPNKTVQWECVPLHGGNVYAAPECPSEIVRKVIEFAQPDCQLYYQAENVPTDNLGRVKNIDGIAYKRRREIEWEGAGGLSALRANIALSAGLAVVRARRNNDGFLADKTPYALTAPTYYAGFVPNCGPGKRRGKPRQVWAMSLEEGHYPRMFEMPNRVDRRKQCEEAVWSQGLDPELIDLDDHEGNTLMRQDPVTGVRLFSKLDIMTIRNTRRHYQSSRSWLTLLGSKLTATV